MENRKPLESLLRKIPTYSKNLSFKKAFEYYTQNVKGSLFEDSLDFREQGVGDLLIFNQEPSSHNNLRNQYVIVAAVGKPLKLLRYNEQGEGIEVTATTYKAEKAYKILQELEADTWVGKKSGNNLRVEIENLESLIKNINEEIDKARIELKNLTSQQVESPASRLPRRASPPAKRKKFAVHPGDKRSNQPTVKELQHKIMELEDKATEYRSRKNQYEISQLVANLEHNERLQNIRKSHLLDELGRNLPPSVTMKEEEVVKIVEDTVEAVKAIEDYWQSLNAVAQATGVSAVEQLADQFSNMDGEARKVAKAKLAIFKKAVAQMPVATPSMQQAMKDMLQAIIRVEVKLKLASLKAPDKIVGQHALEIIHALKINDTNRVLLAIERLGEFLSKPENKELDLSSLNEVKMLLEKEMPVSFGIIRMVRDVVCQNNNKEFQGRMQVALRTLSKLCDKPLKIRKELENLHPEDSPRKEAKQFIDKHLIPHKAEREKIEGLIANLEKESLSLVNVAAKERAIRLTEELKREITNYYSQEQSAASVQKFAQNFKRNIGEAQRDLAKNATSGWRGALEAVKYFMSNLTLSKSQEKNVGKTSNPYTFYATTKDFRKAVNEVKEQIDVTAKVTIKKRP